MQKETKKILAFSILSLLVISLITTFVSADTADQVADTAKGAVVGAGQGLAALFGPLFGQQETLTKFFFAILLFMIIYTIVEGMFKGSKTTTIITSTIITVLAVWFMPSALITTVRDQYGIMGAAILSVIPLMIMLVFTVRVGSILTGKILWIFWICYYFAVYLYRIFSNSTGWLSSDNIIYLGAIIAGLIMVFALKPIRDLLFKGKLEDIAEAGTQTIESAELLHELQKKELNAYKRSAKNN